jgi:hypothetical protein
MSENLISRYLGETINERAEASTGYRAYAVADEQRSREIMLDLRRKAGDREAFAYSYLMRITFVRSEGITLKFSDGQVCISGRNLEQLYENLRRHTVIWIQEGNEAESMAVEENLPFIESIEIKAQ